MSDNSVVVLDRGDYTTVAVNLFGGTIVSWRIKNKEILFVPSTSKFDDLWVLFGGIKYAFPYFGYSAVGPKHGITKNTQWIVEQAPRKLGNGDIKAVFSFQNNKFTHSIWNFRFKISYTLVLGTSKLSLRLSILNTSLYFPFYFKVMRYALINVKEVTNCKIVGLKGQFYHGVDTEDLEFRGKDDNDHIKLNNDSNEIYRVYEEVPEEVRLLNFDQDKSMTFKFQPTTIDGYLFEPLEMMVWSPYYEQVLDTRYYKDVDEDHIDVKTLLSHCACVGAGISTEPVHLEPGSEFCTYEEIEVVDEEEQRRYHMLSSLKLEEYMSKFC